MDYGLPACYIYNPAQRVLWYLQLFLNIGLVKYFKSLDT